MKALLVNISPAVAKGVYSGKKHIPVRQIPNLGGEQDVKVYLCENEKVTGVADYVGSKAQKEPFEGAVEDIYHLYVAWEIANAQQFDAPKSTEEYGLKRPPQEWCYLNVK